jgi:hypothetical protein
MLFRHKKPLPIELVPPPTDRDTPQTTSHMAPNQTRQPARSLGEILGLAPNPSRPVAHRPSSPTKNYQSASPTRAGHTPARVPGRKPSRKKTGHATIRTDATETQVAFESDAFAVHMPTTRLPIIDQPVSPIKTTRAAQVEAYRTYEEKARQVRERHNSQGVCIAEKIVSYEQSSAHVQDWHASVVPAVNQTVTTPKPAGSFPISPPLPQSTWARSERRQAIYVPSLRMADESSVLNTPRKPIVAKSNMSPNTTRFRSRADSEAGASAPISVATPSPTPRPNPIRIRVQTKPKLAIPPASEQVQKESTYSLYNRPPASTSTSQARSTSPVKSMPNFTRQNSVGGDSIFGYRSKDLAGTTAGASAPFPSLFGSNNKPKEKENATAKTKAQDKQKKERSKWPGLRPSGPRLAKPTTTPVVFSSHTTTAAKVSATHAQARPVSAYFDPFVRLATPPAPPAPLFKIPAETPSALRPASPRKVLQPVSTIPPGQHVSTGFTQLRSFGLVVLRVAFYLYALTAVWFVLDAIREAFHTIGVPFRLLRFLGGYVWVGVVWVGRLMIEIWARWGFRVALKGVWMWKMAAW